MKKNKKILIAFLAFLILDLSSSQNEYYDYFRSPTFSDYGTVGLLNMPSARTLDEGSLAFHWSRTQPYLRGSIVATPFSWFEALYKYTDINDKLYSPIRSFSGGQSLKDKAFDAKFILLFENEYVPQLAVGFRDLGGTNRFASEYLVASKAVKNFDFTIGMGWGKLAGRNNLSNPLTNLNNRFDVRGNSGERGTGGKLSTDAWFSGEKASIFGGFEYFPKFYPRLRLKLEYDSTDFDTEGERQSSKSHRLISVSHINSQELLIFMQAMLEEIHYKWGLLLRVLLEIEIHIRSKKIPLYYLTKKHQLQQRLLLQETRDQCIC